MSLTTSPATPNATPASPFDAATLLRLPADLKLTPKQFELVCAENRESVLELTANGRVLVMTPTGSETGSRNGELFFQLKLFAQHQGLWKAFDSSTGFLLPDGSVLSPDASLVRLDRWQALSPEQRRGFAPLCPDLVVELASPSDEGPRGLKALRKKMGAYQANGAPLAWLLLPQEQAVEVWSANAEPQRLEQIQLLDASGELSGLQLQLAKIWAG